MPTVTGTDSSAGAGQHQNSGRLWRFGGFIVIVLAAVVLLVLWAAVAQVRWGDEGGPSATVTGEAKLTRDQPVVVVEFEASFVSLRDRSGIDGQLESVRPAPAEMVEVEWVELTHWDGGTWLRGQSLEITDVGLNTFRFQWILQLREGFDSATVPLKATLHTAWSEGSDEPPPDETDVSDLRLKLVSIDPPR